MNDPMDPTWFRQVLGQYPTGVCVVTALPSDGPPAGLTVGSFTSVSLDPPLVAFLPDKSSTSWPKIQSAGRFCVNILAADQEQVCRSLAVKGPDKFKGLEWRPAESGAPILQGVVAWIDCDLEALHEAGDHYIVLGRVRQLEIENPALPLLFYQGGYGRFSPLSLAAPNRHGALTDELRLVDVVRSEMETMTAELGCQCIATARVEDELVIMASAGRPTLKTGPTLVGAHVPWIPPLGAAWAAWGAPDLTEAWLAHLDTPEEREDYRDRLAAVRDRGYSVGLLNAAHRKFAATLENLATTPEIDIDELRQLIHDLDYDPVELSPDVKRDIRIIIPPVFGADGRVALILTIYGFPNPAQSGGIDKVVARVLEGSQRATEQLGGRVAAASAPA